MFKPIGLDDGQNV